MNANFRGKRASPTNDFWHQKSRVPELSYGEKKLQKSSTAWVGCTNVTDNRQQTDRQTDGRPIAYSERNVVRSLKIASPYRGPQNTTQTRLLTTSALFPMNVLPQVKHCHCYFHIRELLRCLDSPTAIATSIVHAILDYFSSLHCCLRDVSGFVVCRTCCRWSSYISFCYSYPDSPSMTDKNSSGDEIANVLVNDGIAHT